MGLRRRRDGAQLVEPVGPHAGPVRRRQLGPQQQRRPDGPTAGRVRPAIEEPAEVLPVFVEANLAFLRTHRSHAAALVRIKQDVAPAELARSDQDRLADVLRLGQASGVLREFDPHLVAVFILSIRDGIVRQLELEPGLDLDAAGREFAALVDLATRKA